MEFEMLFMKVSETLLSIRWENYIAKLDMKSF